MKILASLLKYLVGLIVVLAAAGASFQWFASSRDAQRFPMPGERIDIGGRSLHLYCSGDGPVTALLENGLSGNYSAWRPVQASIAPFARVCSYDRAGLGWSDKSDRPTRTQFVVDDLHRLRIAAGLKPPFILVGWSAGGVFVRRYYQEHPHDVIGMVLVDSSHDQQRSRLADPFDAQEHQHDMARQLGLCRALAWSGIVRASGAMEQAVAPLHLSEDLEAEVVAMQNRTNYCRGVVSEMQGFEADVSQTDPPASLGDLPLIVLTRGRASTQTEYPMPVSQLYLDQLDRNWITLQTELAALSTRASHRIVRDSGHAIPLQAPDDVVTAVRDIIADRVGVSDG